MSRRYGDLHLCVWTRWYGLIQSWSLELLHHAFMSCALATHQWVTKWAVFLDGLNFASGNIPVFVFFLSFLMPCTIPDNRVALKCSVYRQALREPLVHSLISLNGAVVSRGAWRHWFISFFYSSNNIIHFCWCCWNSCTLPNRAVSLVMHVRWGLAVSHFFKISFFFFFYFPVLVDYRGQSMADCQHQMKRPCSHYLSASSEQRKADRLKQSRRSSLE